MRANETPRATPRVLRLLRLLRRRAAFALPLHLRSSAAHAHTLHHYDLPTPRPKQNQPLRRALADRRAPPHDRRRAVAVRLRRLWHALLWRLWLPPDLLRADRRPAVDDADAARGRLCVQLRAGERQLCARPSVLLSVAWTECRVERAAWRVQREGCAARRRQHRRAQADAPMLTVSTPLYTNQHTPATRARWAPASGSRRRARTGTTCRGGGGHVLACAISCVEPGQRQTPSFP